MSRAGHLTTGDIRPGLPVQVRSVREFTAFVDGWCGQVADPAWNNGHVVVQCFRPDGLKTFYLAPGDLVRDAAAEMIRKGLAR